MAVSLFCHLCTFVCLFLFGERETRILCLHVCTPRLHQKFGRIFCNNSDILSTFCLPRILQYLAWKMVRKWLAKPLRP